VTGNERLPGSRFAVNNHVVGWIATNNRPEFSSHGLDLAIPADDTSAFRDVANLQQLLASENVGSVGVVFIKVKEGIVSGILVAAVEVRELGRFLSHQYQTSRMGPT
jgi:hypothetical protein